MSVVLINDSTLTDIADAIREQNGTQTTYLPSDMPDAIAAIEGGGGGTTPEIIVDLHPILDSNQLFGQGTEKALKYIKCPYATRTDLSHNRPVKMSKMFFAADMTSIPKAHIPQIRVPSRGYESNLYNGYYILEIPNFCQYAQIDTIDTSILKIKKSDGTSLNGAGLDIFDVSYFATNSTVKTIGDLSQYFSYVPDTDSAGPNNDKHISNFQGFCSGCQQLQSIHPNTLKILKAKNPNTNVNKKYLKYNTFNFCGQLRALDKWPVVTNSTLNKVDFGGQLANLYSLNSFIFDTNNGTPYSVNWSNHTLTIGDYVGWGPSTYTPPASGSAIQTDKSLSVYNHDSAVATINSLPSTSGACTLVFSHPSQGSATAGGAISALTPEEIAVATAKNWTITLSQES